MKTILKGLFFGMFLLLFSACKNDDSPAKTQSNSINKILSLGASRVEGARPEYESYRYELWKALVENGWAFDFIGTRSDDATYPVFNGLDFDIDHEGRGGFTSAEILEEVNEWLGETGAPDIVLFSSPGGNDILNGSASIDEISANINKIIDILQEKNPKVTIVIEKLAPGNSSFMTAEFTANFNAVHQEVETIASNQTTTTSQVLTVDMATDFTDAMLADDVHYNEAGAAFIAARYYGLLVDILEK